MRRDRSSYCRPIVMVSRCLGFAACRYDGQQLEDSFIAALGAYTELHTVCPEVEMGMETPRDPIRLVEQGAERLLLQPATGDDFSATAANFAALRVAEIEAVDGFILKSRSPSCGVVDTKIYDAIDASEPLSASSGFFALALASSRFGDRPMQDELRLGDPAARRLFLLRLFVQAELRLGAHDPEAIAAVQARLTRYGIELPVLWSVELAADIDWEEFFPVELLEI